MSETLALLHLTLLNERGIPAVGVCIWRLGDHGDSAQQMSVGEFLSRPENQSGEWLIDGGWGGPPGPIVVEWRDGQWHNLGFNGRRRVAMPK